MEAIQLDARILFYVTRNIDDTLDIQFYDTNGLPLNRLNCTIDKIDLCVEGFRPKEDKIQILTYPEENWFQDGCQPADFTREFHAV